MAAADVAADAAVEAAAGAAVDAALDAAVDAAAAADTSVDSHDDAASLGSSSSNRAAGARSPVPATAPAPAKRKVVESFADDCRADGAVRMVLSSDSGESGSWRMQLSRARDARRIETIMPPVRVLSQAARAPRYFVPDSDIAFDLAIRDANETFSRWQRQMALHRAASAAPASIASTTMEPLDAIASGS